MINEPYTKQQEKEYQAILLDLQKKKQSYGDLTGKEKKIHDLEARLTVVKSEFAKICGDIDERKNEMAELNDALDSLKGNKKSVKIVEIEKQIDALYDKKKELSENRRKEHEIIKQKEDEHAKYMEVMSKQIEIENKKKEQRIKLRKMTEELVNMETIRNGFDSNKYDTMIKELEKKSVSIGLIGLLSEEKLKVPRVEADYEVLLKTLKKRRDSFEKGCLEKCLSLMLRLRIWK